MEIEMCKCEDILPNYLLNKIPKQKIGNSRDSIAVCRFSHTLDIYKMAKKRLLDVNNWFNFTSITNLHFQLLDKNNQPINESLKIDDCIKIQFLKEYSFDILDYIMNDWVKVNKIQEQIKENEMYFILELIPVPSVNKNEMKHFYNAGASNTFILYRNNDLVSLSIHGRNEYPNLKSQSKFNIFRNIMMANLGIIGVDRFLWNKFAKNLLNP